MFDHKNVKTENLLFLYFYENAFLTCFLAYKIKKPMRRHLHVPSTCFLERGFYLFFSLLKKLFEPICFEFAVVFTERGCKITKELFLFGA